MTTEGWISAANVIGMFGAGIFLAVNRWVLTRGETETRISRDLAESDRMQLLRDGATESSLRRMDARIEQVHVKASDRMDAIDRHVNLLDNRIVALETILKYRTTDAR